MELYKRFKGVYLPGQTTYKQDDTVEVEINKQIRSWVIEQEKKFPTKFDFRITNTEHVLVSSANFGFGTPFMMVIINIAYTIK